MVYSEIHLPLIALGELLAGFAAGTRAVKNREALAPFMASPRVSLLEPTNDLWIAALARQHRLSLLSLDSQAGPVPCGD